MLTLTPKQTVVWLDHLERTELRRHLFYHRSDQNQPVQVTSIPKKEGRHRPSLNNHAAIFLPFLPSAADVAILALPFAHVRNAVICSAMSFDSGTRSFNTRDTVRSVGSCSSANAAYMASMNVCSISLPVKPSVALASADISNSSGSRRYLPI